MIHYIFVLSSIMYMLSYNEDLFFEAKYNKKYTAFYFNDTFLIP